MSRFNQNRRAEIFENNKKVRFRMFKSGKQWLVSGTATLSGVVGGYFLGGTGAFADTTNAKTIETDDKALLVNADTATIPAVNDDATSASQSLSVSTSKSESFSVSVSEATLSEQVTQADTDNRSMVSTQSVESASTSSVTVECDHESTQSKSVSDQTDDSHVQKSVSVTEQPNVTQSENEEASETDNNSGSTIASAIQDDATVSASIRQSTWDSASVLTQWRMLLKMVLL